MMSPLLLFSSSPSLVSIAVAVSAHCAVPLCCQCWCASLPLLCHGHCHCLLHFAAVVPIWKPHISPFSFPPAVCFRPLSLLQDCTAVASSWLLFFTLSITVIAAVVATACSIVMQAGTASTTASFCHFLPLLLAAASCHCFLLLLVIASWLLQTANVCWDTVLIG